MDFATLATGTALAIANIAVILAAIWIGGRVAYRFDHALPGFIAGAALYAVAALLQVQVIGVENFRCDPPGKYAYCSGSDDEWRAR